MIGFSYHNNFKKDKNSSSIGPSSGRSKINNYSGFPGSQSTGIKNREKSS